MATGTSLVPEVKKVGVVGLGLMGHGILQTAAQQGFQAVGVDADDAAVSRGVGYIDQSLANITKSAVKKSKMTQEEADRFLEDTKSRLTTTTDKGALADCDLVIEAILENVDAKQSLFRELGTIVQPKGILATNTSSLPVSKVSDVSGRPERVVGLHFFNPVQMMKLVEVIKTPQTSDEVFDVARRFGVAMGKEAVACRDTPGFVVNRLLVPFMTQAIAMYERGDASAEDIDKGMQFGANHPMGPLTLADFVGLDTCLFILQGWVEDYPNEPAFFIPKLLETMVADGKLGRKSGQGFYKWEGGKKVE